MSKLVHKIFLTIVFLSYSCLGNISLTEQLFAQTKKDPAKEKAELLEYHYKTAIELYNRGEYTNAISQWQEILKIDPDQKQPPLLIKIAGKKIIGQKNKVALEYYEQSKYTEAIAVWQEILKSEPNNEQAKEMIKNAGEKIKEKNAATYKEVEDAYKKGQYKLAREKCAEILASNPTDEETKIVYNKLAKIIEITPEEIKNDKTLNLVRKGLTHYLAKGGEPKTAINTLRYALELSPENKKIEKLSELIELEYADLAKAEKVTPGMDLIEQKLFVALNHIYDGRYDLAIDECQQILELEPENLLALKRFGSAYYGLGKKTKAKEIWQKALKIYPNDSELKQFLKE